MKRTDKDVMILLHKPVKTVVGKKKKKAKDCSKPGTCSQEWLNMDATKRRENVPVINFLILLVCGHQLVASGVKAETPKCLG